MVFEKPENKQQIKWDPDEFFTDIKHDHIPETGVKPIEEQKQFFIPADNLFDHTN